MDAIEGWPSAMGEYDKRLTEISGISSGRASQRGNVLSVGFGPDNGGFEKSIYYVDPSRKTFSHLTKYKGLFGIINSGQMRLYNLQNSNDPNELFTLKDISPEYANAARNLKPFVFKFSFVSSDRIANPALWIEYGEVAINFEIVNDPMKWSHYRISPMHYGESEFANKYSMLLKEMQKKHNEWEFEPDPESVLSLLAFHKEAKHKTEEEIRLLFVPFMLQDQGEQRYDFRCDDTLAGFTRYVELPLYVNTSEERIPTLVSHAERHPTKKDDSLPQIKITSIEFGDSQPNFGQEELDRIRYELEDYLLAKFGYSIEVKAALFKTGLAKT